jgi:hypothetical protein
MIGFLLHFQSLKKLGFRTGNTLLATFDKDLISLELLASSAFSVGALTRESNLDGVFLLETNGVFAARANKGSMVLSGDLENLGSFVGLENGYDGEWEQGSLNIRVAQPELGCVSLPLRRSLCDQ